MPQRLVLPTIQNWSCHNCGGCCRQHAIIITREEKQRIVSQNWTPADGIPEKMFSKFGSDERLSTTADGSCIFLNEKGLCKIHAKFGEPAKPLACRVYPYAFHPAGDEIVLGLRYSCPSIVANKGATMQQQRGDLNTLHKLVVPDGADKIPPPAISGNQFLTWEETQTIVEALSQLFAHEQLPLPLKLLQADFIVRMVAKADFEKIRGERVGELMQILLDNAASEISHDLASLKSPDGLTKTQFRVIVAQFARHDSFAKSSSGMGYRIRMMLAGLKMARGSGNAPAIQSLLSAVPFDHIEEPIAYSSSDDETQVDELWSRYFIVKLLGMHFAGRACYNLPVAEGLQRLLLIYPVTMYIARWLAKSKQQSTMAISNVQQALTITDHHHGYSPAMAQANFRSRANYIFKQNALSQLIAWMSCESPPSNVR